MNVCHAYLFFSIRFAGGTSDLMFKICKAQEKLGLLPIVCSGDYRFDFELAKRLKKTKFHIFRSYFNALGFSIMPGFITKMKREVLNYDVVHMHVFRTFQNVILYYYCRKYGVPYIVDAHGAVPYFKRKKWLKKIFDLLVGYSMLSNASAIVAETAVGVKEYKKIFPKIDNNKIKIISPPFDTEEFEILPEKGKFRTKFGISDTCKIIMFLGRINYIKGNDFLIKGFAELLKSRKDCCLLLVGSDDGHMRECEDLARDLKINDKVKFSGFLEGREKLSALVDADIFAQMSRREQGAWAPFEAVLCETPIVVTRDTGAGEDVVRIDAGYTVPFGDVIELAKIFNYIFNNCEEAAHRAKQAKKFIMERMSMNSRAHEYTDLYEECIKSNKKIFRET